MWYAGQQRQSSSAFEGLEAALKGTNLQCLCGEAQGVQNEALAGSGILTAIACIRPYQFKTVHSTVRNFTCLVQCHLHGAVPPAAQVFISQSATSL